MNHTHKILLILLVFTNWFFAIRLQQVFTNGLAYGDMIWALASFIAWTTVLSLNLILVKKYWSQTGAFIFGVLGFFTAGINIFIISAVILLFLSFLYTRRYVRVSLENLIKIKSYDMLYYNFWYFILAVFIVVSVIYYTSPQLDHELDLTIPPTLFDSVFRIIELTFGEFGNIGKTGVDTSQVNGLIDSVKTESYEAANDYLATLKKPYEIYIPGALAIGLFLSLQILNWPLRMLIASITNAILWLLLALGIVKKDTTQVEKEILI